MSAVDLHQTFESDTLDTTSLDANDHFATTGRWSITDASSKLSTGAAAQMSYAGEIGGESDTGTRGLIYDCNGGAQAYLTFSHPVQLTQLSWSFRFRFTGAGFSSSFGEYDLFRNSTDLGVKPSLIKLVDDTNETRLHLFVPSTYSAGIAIQPDTVYFLTGKHVKNGTVIIRLCDADLNQIGADQEIAVGNENLTELLFGPFVGGPDVDSGIHLDNLVLDWTNATFPLLPTQSSLETSVMAFQTGFSPRQFQALFDIMFGSATVNPADLAQGADGQVNVTATGVAVGDAVLFFPGVAITSGVTVQATVSAANTITLTFDNESADHVDLASSTWRFVVLRPKGNFRSI